MRSSLNRQLERIVRRPDYLRIVRERRNVVTPGFVLQVATIGSSGPGPRIGYTVSKKVGNAVARNKVRRRLKAVVNDVFSGRLEEPFDYVLIGRAKGVTRSYDLLLNDLRYALKSIDRGKKGFKERTAYGNIK